MFFNKLFGKYKFVTMTVILALLVVCLILVIVNLYSGADTDDEVTTEPVSQSLAMHSGSDGELSGDSSFLVVCTDDDSDDILFMFIADFRIYSSSLLITPLSPETVVSDGRTYDDIYSYGGINMLRSGVESVRNVYIDRYAVLDRDGLSGITDLIGEINILVDEDFTYQSSDKSYEVSVGENDMGSDMLFTYLMLYAQKYGAEKFAELACDIINSYISSAEKDDIEKLFAGLTNCFNTDVTISDYYSAKSDIEYLVEHDFKCMIANDVD